MSITYILNLFSTHVQVVKVGQKCNVGSQAPTGVSLTPNHGYKLERDDAHFIINSSHTSLSHMIGLYNLEEASLSSTRVKQVARNCGLFLGFFWTVDER